MHRKGRMSQYPAAFSMFLVALAANAGQANDAGRVTVATSEITINDVGARGRASLRISVSAWPATP